MKESITITDNRSGESIEIPIEYAVDLKKRSAKNEIIAPRILVYTGFGQGSKKPITSEEQAREWVRQNAKNGADGIKFFGAEPHIMTAALDENKN